MLKPFVVLANQIMGPFTKLAMGVMRDGQRMMTEGNTTGGMAAMAGAGAIAIAGLSSVIIAISVEILQLVSDLVFQGLGLITSYLIVAMGGLLASFVEILGFSGDSIRQRSAEMGESVLNGMISAGEGINSGLDIMGATAVTGLSLMAATTAEAFGTETDDFRTTMATNITNIFAGADGLSGVFETMLGVTNENGSFKATGTDAIKEAIGASGLSGTFGDELDSFKTNGVSKISGAVSAFNAEMDKIRSKAKKASELGFIGRAIKNIGDDDLWLG